MMKRLALILLPLILLCGCAMQGNTTPIRAAAQLLAETEDIQSPANPDEGFYYDPAVYPPWYGYPMADDAWGNPNHLEDVENTTKRVFPQNALIAICEVAGKSISTYGDSVITPIKILDVIYQSDKVTAQRNDTINVVEPYLIISEEVKRSNPECTLPLNTAACTYCDPMEVGRTYLLYLVSNDFSEYSTLSKDDPENTDVYQGEFLFTSPGRKFVYCLSDDNLSEEAAKNASYVSLCKEAREKYQSRYEEVMAARGK